MSFCRLFQL